MLLDKSIAIITSRERLKTSLCISPHWGRARAIITKTDPMRKSHLDGWLRPDLISETPEKVALTRLTLERLESETILFLNTIVASIPRTGIASAKR